MSKFTDYFRAEELVCQHVYERFGDRALDFIDSRLKETLVVLREKLDRPIYINNWVWGGDKTQRGLRCNVCALFKEKTALEKPYLSAHVFGKGVDFNVKGMTAQQVRDWLKQNQILLPYPIRVESDVTWVHIDLMEYGQTGDKISYFKG